MTTDTIIKLRVFINQSIQIFQQCAASITGSLLEFVAAGIRNVFLPQQKASDSSRSRSV
jgi:hypothetical protein